MTCFVPNLITIWPQSHGKVALRMLNYEFNCGLRKLIFYFYQIWCPEKVDNLQKFCSRRNKPFAGILILLVFSKSGIQYLRQRKISACKVLVPIKVVPVKNDHYYSRNISHELIVRLIPTWIWYDLLRVCQFWSSNH